MKYYEPLNNHTYRGLSSNQIKYIKHNSSIILDNIAFGYSHNYSEKEINDYIKTATSEHENFIKKIKKGFGFIFENQTQLYVIKEQA